MTPEFVGCLEMKVSLVSDKITVAVGCGPQACGKAYMSLPRKYVSVKRMHIKFACLKRTVIFAE